MTAIKELLSHSSNYFVGRVLILIAGFISMPVLTRILSKEDYGLMSLVFLSVTLLGTIATIGLPQATTRFYPEYNKKGGPGHVRQFCTSITLSSSISSSLTIIFIVALSYVLERNQSFANVGYYLRFVSIIILIRGLTNVFLEIYRADKKPLIFNLTSVSNRYLTVLCSILLVLYVYRNIKGVFVATIIVEGIIAIVCGFYLFSGGKIGKTAVSYKMISDAVKFGFPLVISDMLTSFMTSSDRFIIQYFMNAEAVASYSVAYDLSDNLATMCMTPIRLAVIPILFSLWMDEGTKKTSQFISRVTTYTLVMIIPVIFGFSFLGTDIIIIMASTKYSDSGILVPFLISGIMLVSIHFLFFSGLLISKKTRTITLLNLIGGVVNIFLNFLLIPYYGIVGAAFTTLVTYIFLLIITYKVSSQFLKIEIDWLLIVKSLVISTLMIFLIMALGDLSHQLIIDIVLKSLIGFIIYSGVLVIIDKKMKEFIMSTIRGKINR